MSFYPTYALQVYSSSQRQWVPTPNEASNRPHHYDLLLREWQRLVASARCEASPRQGPLGYRITCNGHPVDVWVNAAAQLQLDPKP